MIKSIQHALIAQTIELVDMLEMNGLAKPLDIKACYLLAETIIIPGGIL